MTEEIEKNKKGIGILDLGTVKVGYEKVNSFYIKNIHKTARAVELKFKIENSEVDILKFPKSLKPGESSELKVRYKPSITIEQGLRTKLEIKGGAILPPPKEQ